MFPKTIRNLKKNTLHYKCVVFYLKLLELLYAYFGIILLPQIKYVLKSV